MLARPSEAAMPASATFTANEPASVSHSYAVDALDAVDAAAVDSDIVESTAPLEPELVQSIVVEPSPRRPVTSEMVAIDAFEAFDAVWGPSNTPQASPVVSTTAFPVDAESLGSALDGPNPWTDEMTAVPDASPSFAEQQDMAGADSRGDVIDSGWSRAVTPDSALPAWLLEQPAAMEPPLAFADGPIDVPAASAEPAELAEPAVGEISSRMLAARAETTTAPVSSELITSEPAAATTAHVTSILRVSAALERLAERVRGGEIDVSSVAPEAPDPAMLASVLAALLGGSSSR